MSILILQQITTNVYNPTFGGKLYPDGVFSVGRIPLKQSSSTTSPLSSSKLNNHHKTASKYGSKGITAKGKRTVSCSALLLEKKYGKKRLGFGTATLPPLDKEGLEECLKNWGEITRRFFQEIKRVMERKGHKFLYVAVTEIQEKRFKREGMPYPHLHWVYVAKDKANKDWYVSASLLRTIWRRIIVKTIKKGKFVRNPSQKEFAASINCSTIRKSASAYIGKYMSKGSVTIASMQKAGFNNYPAQWWTACKAVKAMFVKSIIKLDSATCADFMDNLESFLKLKIVVWAKYIHRLIDQEERCFGLVGRLSKQEYKKFRSSSFDLN